jgi:tetratricopeptide (TPR) repeat protein
MIRRTRLFSWLLAAGACLCTIAPAHAQTAPAAKRAAPQRPSQKDLDEARKHFQRAEAAKARGEYQTAAVEYLAAYELFQEPAFFYDTAEVYRLAGDEKNALVYYTKYLELSPDGKVAAAARIAADQLRRSIAAQEDAARIADEARRNAEAEARRKAEQDANARTAQGTKAAAPAKREPAAREPTTGRTMRIAGLVTGSAGVIALGVGVFFGVQARSLSNDAASWDTFDRKRDDKGKADQRNMVVFTGVGAAALVAGGVLYYLGHRAESVDHSAVSVAPSIGPSHVALTAVGRF